MTRNDLIAFAAPVLIGIAMIFGTTCSHAQSLAPAENPLAAIGDWSVIPQASIAAPALPYVYVSGAAFIQSSTPPFTSWKAESGNVFLADGVKLFRGIGNFTLAWDDTMESGITYVVCSGPTNGVWLWETNCGTNLTVTVPALWLGTNYFVAFCQAADGSRSEPSNVASAVAVKPKLTITRL